MTATPSRWTATPGGCGSPGPAGRGPSTHRPTAPGGGCCAISRSAGTPVSWSGSASWPSHRRARGVRPRSTTSRSVLAPRRTSATAADRPLLPGREAARRPAPRASHHTSLFHPTSIPSHQPSAFRRGSVAHRSPKRGPWGTQVPFAGSQAERGAELGGGGGGGGAAAFVAVETAGGGGGLAGSGERVHAVRQQRGRAGHAEPFGVGLAGHELTGEEDVGTGREQRSQPGFQDGRVGTVRHLQDHQFHDGSQRQALGSRLWYFL